MLSPINKAMDALSMDLTPPPEKEKYTTNTTTLAAINKFTVQHGYGVTEQQSKPNKYNMPKKY